MEPESLTMQMLRQIEIQIMEGIEWDNQEITKKLKELNTMEKRRDQEKVRLEDLKNTIRRLENDGS